MENAGNNLFSDLHSMLVIARNSKIYIGYILLRLVRGQNGKRYF